MTDTGRAREAADWLHGEIEDGRDMAALPGELQPADLAEAYAVQEILVDRMIAAGAGPLGGWKIALTTPTMQAFVGADRPCAGAILADRIHQSPATLSRASFQRLGVEAEIAVRMGHDLAGGGDGGRNRDAVADAVAAIMPAIELIEDRHAVYGDFDVRLLVANNSLNAGCVLGPETQDWRALDLPDLAGRMHLNGEVVGEGHGRDVLGHPLDAVAWLADNLAMRGQTLRAGQVVLTGSVVKTHFLEAGDTMACELDGLGQAEVRVV